MQKPKFVENQIYHLYNRGVEKRRVFLEDKDYLRFIHDLFEFNDVEPTLNLNYHFDRNSKSIGVELPYIRKPRKLLVEILAFCLMPNHYHLLVRQLVDNGIVKFMQKLGTGYTNYFNEKNERVGSLFQGRFKAVLIKEEKHFIHLPYYINVVNPLELMESRFKDGKIKNLKKALKFLETFRWSSHLDYAGKKNFPSVTQRDFLLEIFGGPKNYEKTIEKWLKEFDFEELKDIALE